MECPRCHNVHAEHLFQIQNRLYCRECIQFHRVFTDDKRETVKMLYPPWEGHYHLDFQLSQKQQMISNQLVKNYKENKDSLISAVCGAGKTEIVFEVIQYALSHGQRVCFCIPRKELVKELYARMKKAFDIEMGLVYGGCCERIDAQFIVCTMHQLYRFENHVGFDLLIGDEVDAFPFYQNKVLNEIFERCCLGSYIKMSATFVEEDVKHEEVVVMNRRYHGYDLPVPRVLFIPYVFQKYCVKKLILFMKKRTIVFVPEIQYVDQIVGYLKKLSLKVDGVSSKHKNNQEKIDKLRSGQLDVLVSTTLLERGVTIDDVQVIIYKGEHHVYNRGTLIQMAGRVGRKPYAPHGYVYILSSYKTKDIQACIKSIEKSNSMIA